MDFSSHYTNTDLHLSVLCLLGKRSSLHGQHDWHCRHHASFFSTTLLHPELTQHNLERGVGLGFREI